MKFILTIYAIANNLTTTRSLYNLIKLYDKVQYFVYGNIN